MASNVIRATLLADAQRMKAGFKEGEQAIGGFENKASTVATAVKAFFAIQAVQAIKDFSMAAINSFSDLEQSVGGTEAVFGDSADVIDEWASKSADALGLSEAQFRTATTSIGGQLKRMTGDVDFAAEQSIILTEVAADLAATYGGTTADAVAALGSAFRGEADPAEKFNLDLKIGKVNAKALEMGLATATDKVDDHARAQAILALITEQSADAQGQFGREADTVAGQQQRLTAEIENQKAAIGEELAPVYLELMGVTRDILPVLGDVAGLIGEVATEAAGIIGPISTMVGWFSKAEGESNLLFDTLSLGKDLLLDILMPWRLFNQETEDAIPLSRDYQRVLDLQNQAIITSTGAIEEHTKSQEELEEEQKRLAAEVEASTKRIQEAVTRRIKQAQDDFTGAYASMQEASKRTWTDAATDVEEFLTGFEATPERLNVTLEQWVENFNARMLELQEFETNMGLLADAGFDAFVDEARRQGPAAAGVVEEMVGLLATDPARAQEINLMVSHGEALTLGLAQGVTRGEWAAQQAARAAATRTVRAFKDKLGIGSPSKVMAEEVGKPIAEGIGMGIDEASSELTRSVDAASSQMAGGGGARSSGSGGSGVVNNFYIQALGPKDVVEALKQWVRDNGGRSPF